MGLPGFPGARDAGPRGRVAGSAGGAAARRGLTVAALLAAPLLPGCDEAACPSLRAELRSQYEPYGDTCDEGSACASGSCDVARAGGVCRCESDGECRSGLCLDGLCANPGHDRRLTPGLAERGGGAQVKALCPGTDRLARRQAPDCARVLAFLEEGGCSACDEAALKLCACRSGGGLHECLLRASGGVAPAETDLRLDEDDEAQIQLCEAQAEHLECGDHLGPDGARCGDASSGATECLSGLCRDSDPANNAGDEGDDPADWICVTACSTDTDCPRDHRCDLQTPLPDAPSGTPHTCRRRP